MGKYLFIFLFIAAIPWGISTWWDMLRAKTDKERAFIGRSSLAIGLGTVVCAAAVVMLSARGNLFAVPLVISGYLGARHYQQKARARIREEAVREAGDPLARARRLN